jgi:hypothetical protein
MGSEQRAHQLVDRLRSANQDGPFTRLASDFWDQYGMMASISAACASIKGELPTQAGAAVGELHGLGVVSTAQEICTAPGA